MVTGSMIKVIVVFHHRVVIRTAGMMAQRTTRRKWYWPSVSDSLETAGIFPIKSYIQRIQDTIVDQVACQPIYELCTGAERIPVDSSFIRWWE